MISLGSVLRFQTGTPYQEESFDELGIRFIDPRGSLRLEDLRQWDLSASFGWNATPKIELELKLETFNVTHQQSQLGIETRRETGRFGLPRSIADLQRPRSARLTALLRF